jgi:NAD(P)-dependent dehydrogenase (short-subunit alcohol dehydrogenase family)
VLGRRAAPAHTPRVQNVRKIAIVTGAGSGIGRACALGLFRAGWVVVLAGRSAPDALVVPTDVTDAASVKALFARTEEVCGRIDFLFNNAGMNAPAVPLEELSLQQWRDVIETNLTGAFLCAQEAFRVMKRQNPRGGRIVNNGSVSAHVPRPHSAPYTAAKHAITGLTKSLSLDGRAFDIACGQIDIGNAHTALAEKMPRGVLQANGTVAPEPTIAVQHVADALLYLAGLPLDVNVPTITVMANQMPYVGRG